MYIALELGEHSIAFPIDSVWEVIEAGEVVPVPCTFPFVRGVRLHRNQLIPVYDLLQTGLFNSPSAATFDFILLLQYYDSYNGFLGTAIQALSDTLQASRDDDGGLSLDKHEGKEYFIAKGKRHYLVDENELYRHLKIIDETLN